ncbi:hypothetical protein Ssi03_12930 [Sphaerisporangium siamense]|uniref:Peptidoglycan hydrolase-like protein with peptidoglycan-binding domain n=1 Tax=Sphaerisporangium siamense TaxID=795645 RepID=A0A7W7G9K8_9ACTN|nr:peptidoglycan-binding protein [Sphaerisporangium siamense]MBB4702938.1 peptidoglycan hydrolase-like protein with peptidoglycan-binding domain [Sphaerisporangium siamense]GII83303.1 hypothetical protein Ssi03_12930 [Sphaerisporangium siamense]
MTTAAKVIAEARADLGMRENPAGSNLVPITREFGKIPGYPGGGYGYPWCAAATSIWCKAAGLKAGTDYPHTPSTLAQYDWAKTNKRWYSTPKVGDLVLYSSNGTRAGIYHVELVEKVSTSSITTIGGNTSGSAGDGIEGNGDGCYRKTITRGNARIIGYVRPRYADASEAPEKPWDGKSYPGHLVRRGDRGAEVKAVQNMLNAFDWKLDVDADFGPSTEHAVQVFQSNHKLMPDGVVGPDTWKALAAGPLKKEPAKAPAKPPAKAPEPRTLKLKDVGDDVKAAKAKLIAAGYTYITPGTYFDAPTQVAVMDLQARRQLDLTGQIGPQTRKALSL